MTYRLLAHKKVVPYHITCDMTNFQPNRHSRPFLMVLLRCQFEMCQSKVLLFVPNHRGKRFYTDPESMYSNSLMLINWNSVCNDTAPDINLLKYSFLYLYFYFYFSDIFLVETCNRCS
jgi:hypothetical protein